MHVCCDFFECVMSQLYQETVLQGNASVADRWKARASSGLASLTRPHGLADSLDIWPGWRDQWQGLGSTLSDIQKDPQEVPDWLHCERAGRLSPAR